MTANEVRHKGSSSVRGRIKEQKAALIQEEILIAAARLIASRGFRSVTVDDISAEMGFTKSIVYYYMKNKNEILWRIFEKIDETYANGLDDALLSGGSVVEQLSKVMGMHCMNVLSHLDWSTIYNRDLNELIDEQRTTVAENRRQYNRRIRSLYEEGVRLGHFRAAPPIIAVSCLIGACNWPYTWFNPKGKLTAEEIAEGYAKQLIHGVLSQG
jgi:TetR/AcrR family transcriptional regulator, cholesterol catabolism regulator